MKPYTSNCSISLKTICPLILFASIGTQVIQGQDVLPESAEESLQELGIESDFAEVSVIDLGNDDNSTNTQTIQVSTSPKPTTSSSSQKEVLEIIGADSTEANFKSVDTISNSEIQDSPAKKLSQENNRYRVPSEFLNEADSPQEPDAPVTSDLGDVPTEFVPPQIDLIDNLNGVSGPASPSGSSDTLSTSDEIAKSISEELTTAKETKKSAPEKPVVNSATAEVSDSDSDSKPKKKAPASDSDEEWFYDEDDSESSPKPEISSDSEPLAEPVSASLTRNNASFQASTSSFLSAPANDPIGGLNPVSALTFSLPDLPASALFSDTASTIPEPTTGLLLTLSILGILSRRTR